MGFSFEKMIDATSGLEIKKEPEEVGNVNPYYIDKSEIENWLRTLPGGNQKVNAFRNFISAKSKKSDPNKIIAQVAQDFFLWLKENDQL